MMIRKAELEDEAPILAIYSSAFPKSEASDVFRVAARLLTEHSQPETLSLVASIDDSIVGHIAFSPILDQRSAKFIGYILAPLAVSKAHQKMGVGSALIRKGIQLLSEETSGILFVYGDPDYYHRFSFLPEIAEHFIPPHPLQFPTGWQAMPYGPMALPGAPVPITCVPALSRAELW